MWPMSLLEAFTKQIKVASEQPDISDHDRYCRIFEIVREIHIKSRMQGVEECRRLIIRTIDSI